MHHLRVKRFTQIANRKHPNWGAFLFVKTLFITPIISCYSLDIYLLGACFTSNLEFIF